MDLKKLIQKKMGEGEMLDPMEKMAHKKALMGLRKEATETMKPEFDGLKKVTVAADSKAGLKKGLELANKLTPDESPEHEAMETPEEEKLEHLTGEEIQQPADKLFPKADELDADHDKVMNQMHLEESGLSDDEKMMDLPSLEHKIQCLLKRREELKA